MESKQIKILKSVIFSVVLLSGVEVFAQDLIDRHTEAGIQVGCDCSVTGSQNEKNKDNYLDLAKVVDEGVKPVYFEKYNIRAFLDEAIAKEPKKKEAIEESLNRNLMNLQPHEPVKLVEAGVKNGTTEGEVKVAVSQVLASVGKDIPAVKEIADKYIVRLHVNTNVDSHGARLGQTKSLSLEPALVKGEAQEFKGNLTYSQCDQQGTLEIGLKTGCAYKQKLFGDLQMKVMDNVYTGANFSSVNFEATSRGYEGYAFIKVKF